MTNQFRLVDNSNVIEVSFIEAMEAYKSGVLIECRIIDENNVIAEWNKYHLSNGLSIALEFNEIINGKWYVGKESLAWSNSGLSKWIKFI